MVHPPRPGAQCRHHTPEGLSSSSTFASLQHSEQSPQLRPGTGVGIFVSLLIAGTVYHMTHHGVTSAILRLPLPACTSPVAWKRGIVGKANGARLRPAR